MHKLMLEETSDSLSKTRRWPKLLIAWTTKIGNGQDGILVRWHLAKQ